MSAPGFRGILVPLDGSELAEQALPVGVSLARKAGATLHLVGVHVPFPISAMPPEMPLLPKEFEEEVRADLAEYLHSVAAGAQVSLEAPVRTAVPIGPAAEALCEYVQSRPIDLVVMTTHGRGGLSRWWLGSVADRMLRRLEVPVLLLHPRDLPQPTAFQRIVLALDGEIEEPVVAAALALAGSNPATRYVLTRVVEPRIPVLTALAARPAHLAPQWTEVREVEARNYLARLSRQLRASGFDVRRQVMVGRGVAAQVLKLAGTLDADCIVVGTHGADGMERVLLGSAADKIVRGAEVPVLVAPALKGRRLRRHVAAEAPPTPPASPPSPAR